MRPPTLRHYGALAVSILMNSMTLILLKAVALQGSSRIDEAAALSFGTLLSAALSPLFMLAVCAFLAGVVFWVVALRRIDLSLAYPSASLSYGLIALASIHLFAEEVSLLRWAGIAVIVAGVILMFLPERSDRAGASARHHKTSPSEGEVMEH